MKCVSGYEPVYKKEKKTLNQLITLTLPLGWRANDQVSFTVRCSSYFSSIEFLETGRFWFGHHKTSLASISWNRLPYSIGKKLPTCFYYYYFILTWHVTSLQCQWGILIKRKQIKFYWTGELTAQMVKVCGVKDVLFGLGDKIRGGKVTDSCEVQSEPKSAVLTTYRESWKITSPVLISWASYRFLTHCWSVTLFLNWIYPFTLHQLSISFSSFVSSVFIPVFVSLSFFMTVCSYSC